MANKDRPQAERKRAKHESEDQLRSERRLRRRERKHQLRVIKRKATRKSGLRPVKSPS